MSRRLFPFLALALAVLPGCGGGADEALLLYTSVTQETVDAVVAAFAAAAPGVEVEVFRAPTGELNARIAADLRSGGMAADVLWVTDPLTMQAFDAAGLLRAVDPAAGGIPAAYRQDRFWGTRLLNLVVVRNAAAPPVARWEDLVAASAAGGVAVPDPSFAGSAFAALAYFALDEGYGLDFLEHLHAAGAVQVASPGDVVTGVAEGQYAAGITLDSIAYDAVADGAPLEVVWPLPGAIVVYSPIAVTGDHPAAVDFVSFVLGVEGQTVIAGTGWQPVHPEVPWTVGGPQVAVPWQEGFDRQEELLDAWRAIFGG